MLDRFTSLLSRNTTQHEKYVHHLLRWFSTSHSSLCHIIFFFFLNADKTKYKFSFFLLFLFLVQFPNCNILYFYTQDTAMHDSKFKKSIASTTVKNSLSKTSFLSPQFLLVLFFFFFQRTGKLCRGTPDRSAVLQS